MNATINLLKSLFHLSGYNRYHNCVRNFKNKLPRLQNRGRVLSEKEIHALKVGGRNGKCATVVDLSSQKVSGAIEDKDLNALYNGINEIVHEIWFFKKYYRDFTNNLNRLNPKSENGNLELFVLVQILNDPNHPTKFWSVLLFHLKYKFSLTSRIYKWFRTNSRT